MLWRLILTTIVAIPALASTTAAQEGQLQSLTSPEVLQPRRLEAFRVQALERAERVAESDAGMLGRFVQLTPMSFVFEPKDEKLRLKVVNPEILNPGAVGPQVFIKGTLDRAQGRIMIQDYEIRLAASAERLTLPVERARIAATTDTPPSDIEVMGGPSLLRRLDQVVKTFSARVNAMIREASADPTIAVPSSAPEIRRVDDETKGELVDLYIRAVEQNDDRAREMVVRSYAYSSQQLKSIYGEYDNYPPWNYDFIYRNANAVVALGEPHAPQALCSGVLIAEDLVLTAGHCFAEHEPADLEVWFDFVERPAGQLDKSSRQVVALVAPSADKQTAFFNQDFGAALFDYAIVRFEAHPGERLVPLAASTLCSTEPEEAADPALREEWQQRCVRQPQCLFEEDVRRGKSVYVIGYPNGFREMVHDAGRVYLPFELSQREFDELKLEIEADYDGHEDRQAILADFIDSYVQTDGVFRLFDVRYGGQPKLGLVADTFRGNSGSPVYERNTHCLAGLLIGGGEDVGTRLPASWLHHESALPISQILADLAAHGDTRPLLERFRSGPG